MNSLMPSKPSLFPVAGMLLLAASLSLTAADWNRFRGPNGSGNAEAGKLPVTLDAGSTLWKIPVGKG
ncbi:MAG TPA: hypothetical protein VK968_17955, partial [Roseimicrobium sp.]|nr:hypothetical protein [Roseimicrobium sp.]